MGIILLVAIPFIAVQVCAIHEDRTREIEAAHTRTLDIARRGVEQYQSAIAGMHNLMLTLSLVPELVSGSGETCEAFLKNARQKLQWASQLWVMDATGHVVCSSAPGTVGADRSDRAYFKHAMATGEFGVRNFQRGRVTGEPGNVLTLPVLDDAGSVLRVLAVSLRLEWFESLFAEVAGRTGASIMLFDRDNTMLARYPHRTEWIGKDWTGSPLIDQIGGRSDGSGEIVGVEGVPKVVGWATVPGMQAQIAVGFDRDQVLNVINGKTWRSAGWLLAIVLSALAAGLALVRAVVRPLRQLTEGAKAARVSPELSLPRISGYAEVKSLADSLDALLAERRQREVALVDARTASERAEKQARDAHDYLISVIDMLPEGIVIFDKEDRFHLWNRCFSEHYAYGGPLQRGQKFEERLRASTAAGLHLPALGREEEWIAERLARRALPESSLEQEVAGGRWIRVIERRLPDGTLIGVRSDITELKRREESFRLLFDSNPVPMWVHDRKTHQILAVNDATVRLYGYDRDRFLSMRIQDIQLKEYGPAAEHRQKDSVLRERNWQHAKADGSAIDVTTYSRALEYDGRPAKLVAIVDMTENKRAQARISHMAHHDDLTGLANRLAFRASLEAAAKSAIDHSLAVLYVDLDDFKRVNDALGHPFGDRLLRAAAGRIRSLVGPDQAVARLGSDDFAIILGGISGPGEATTLAQRLIDSLSAPYEIDERSIAIGASVGIAIAPQDAKDSERLWRYADMALCAAKADGGFKFKLFEPEMNLRVQARRALEQDLGKALAEERFELYYQPSIDLASGRVAGFEALLRWNHPERGPISPAEFVPIAEDIGLIDKLGEWVLRRACADAATWPRDVRVAVNLSPLQFKNRSLVQTVVLALASSGLSARRLELEITERVLLQEDESNLATLHELRALGARIALDDFGTGYSSMSYLRMFPFDRIKIDRSFVMALPENRECMKIIRAMVELAKSLGIDTTAEGVETSEQLGYLEACGCREGQGYLFSPARPPQEVPALMTRLLTERAA